MTFFRRLTLEAALLWIRSLRPHFVEPPPSVPLPDSGILVLWHEHMLLCLPAFAHQNMRVLISQSRDGDLGARAAERLGYRTVRGSSSRGGAAALKNLARELGETGGWVAVVADGPRGPRRACKPGAAWLAEATGLPLHGVIASAPGYSLKSWDRCRIPFPFTRIRLRLARIADPERVGAAMEENESHLREFLPLP